MERFSIRAKRASWFAGPRRHQHPGGPDAVGPLTAQSLPVRTTEEQDVPADTCIVELDLPEGATVTVDGRDYGSQQPLVLRDSSTTD